VPPERLASLNRGLRGMRLGGFEFVEEGLRLGQLRGNRFELLMRSVGGAPPAAVAAACAAVRDAGFINYFGLQRFGTGVTGTHAVGRLLLRGEWRGAVEAILTSATGDQPPVTAAVAAVLAADGAAGAVDAALRALPRHMTAERALLEGLKRAGPGNYVNALLVRGFFGGFQGFRV